jgi:hypothetical protein
MEGAALFRSTLATLTISNWICEDEDDGIVTGRCEELRKKAVQFVDTTVSSKPNLAEQGRLGPSGPKLMPSPCLARQLNEK